MKLRNYLLGGLLVTGSVPLTTGCEQAIDTTDTEPTTGQTASAIKTAHHGYVYVLADGTISSSYNSGGGTVSLEGGDWTNTGFARLTFAGLGIGTENVGSAHVVAVGTDAGRCNLDGLGQASDPDDRIVEVRCRNANRQPANAAFVVQYNVATPSATGSGGYGIAGFWGGGNQNHVVEASRNWNSAGGVNEIQRDGINKYTVLLPSLAPPTRGGNIQVTAKDKRGGYCLVAPNGSSTGSCDSPLTNELTVRCYHRDGTANSMRFAFHYSSPGEVDIGGVGAYLWSSDPLTASLPSNYNFNSCDSSPSGNSVARVGVGEYTVHHSGISWDQGVPHVTATLSDNDADENHYCKVASWGAGATGGTDVDVRCFDANGDPTNATFVEKFMSKEASCPP